MAMKPNMVRHQGRRLLWGAVFGEALSATASRTGAKAAQKENKKAQQALKKAEKEAAAELKANAAAALKAKAALSAIHAEQVAKLRRGEPVPADVRRLYTCELCGQLEFPPHNADQCQQSYDAQMEASMNDTRKHLDANAAARKGGYRSKSHKKRRSHKKHKSHKKRRTMKSH